MSQIYTEVMLESINFENGKNNLVFRFYDEADTEGSVLNCINVICFNLSCGLLRYDEIFPCLIMEVVCKKISDEKELISYLEKMNFGFRWNGEILPPECKTFWHIRLEGGPLFIDLISEEIQKNN